MLKLIEGLSKLQDLLRQRKQNITYLLDSGDSEVATLYEELSESLRKVKLDSDGNFNQSLIDIAKQYGLDVSKQDGFGDGIIVVVYFKSQQGDYLGRMVF